MPTPGPAPDTSPDAPGPAPGPDPWTALGRGLRDHPDDGLVVLRAIRDADGVVVDLRHEWVNEAADRNAGRPLLGTNLLETYGSDATLFPVMCELLGTGTWLRRRMTFDAATRDTFLHSRVFEVYLADAGDDCVACQYRDVTDLHRARALLEHQAAHDDLTGVPNRRRLVEHLDRVLLDLAAGGPSVLVMLADLDRFKQVNDVHGHPRGDRLLRQAAERMHAAMRAGDVVARYGGDEFVMVCLDVPDEAEAQVLADRLRAAVAGSYRLDERTEVEVGLSVGLALAHQPVTARELLDRADRALYAVKRRGGGPGRIAASR